MVYQYIFILAHTKVFKVKFSKLQNHGSHIRGVIFWITWFYPRADFGILNYQNRNLKSEKMRLRQKWHLPQVWIRLSYFVSFLLWIPWHFRGNFRADLFLNLLVFAQNCWEFHLVLFQFSNLKWYILQYGRIFVPGRSGTSVRIFGRKGRIYLHRR